MIVRAATDGDIRHVIGHLRKADRHEQFACRWDDDAEALAGELIAMREVAIGQFALCTDDGEAAVLVGAYLIGPALGQFHMASTDRLAEIGRAGHRWGRQRFIPLVMEPHLRRCEARVLASHAYARRWCRVCGFEEEGIARARGKAGEDFIHFAWVRERTRP